MFDTVYLSEKIVIQFDYVLHHRLVIIKVFKEERLRKNEIYSLLQQFIPVSLISSHHKCIPFM